MGALTDKYCIVGVGETPHMRPSNRTTLSMACEAVSKAMADAGLKPSDIDGMTSYQAGDSTTSAHVATSLGFDSTIVSIFLAAVRAPKRWSRTRSACSKRVTPK